MLGVIGDVDEASLVKADLYNFHQLNKESQRRDMQVLNCELGSF